MKYSISELDKIRGILVKKEQIAYSKYIEDTEARVSNRPFWEGDSFKQYEKFRDAVQKIDDYFNEVVDEFLKDEL